jgi:uncharacterized protein involved in exopolysaccharide biosynthesis
VSFNIQNSTISPPIEQVNKQRGLDLTEPPPEYMPRLSLRTLLESCFRHPMRLACAAGLPLLCTIVLLLFMPKRYQATMQLAVLNTRQYSVISSDSDAPTKLVGDITDTDVNSQAQLVRSRDVLDQTLNQLGQPDHPALTRDKAIDLLQTKLDVEPVRESNILNVSYVDSSPQKARDTLQALASSFVEKELSVLRPMHARKLFVDLVADRQRELAQAEEEFANFKIKTGIASLKDDEAALLRQVEGLSSQSTTLTTELAREQRRAAKTDIELSSHPDRITTQNRSTPHQQAIESLTTKLVELQNRRTSLLSGYQPTERNVQEVDQQINNVQTQLKELRSANAVETTTDTNPLNLELKSQLAGAEIASTAIAAQRRAVDAERASYVTKLNQLEEQAAEFDSLQKRVAEAQQNVDLAIQKRDRAAVDDALDRDRILNIAFAAKPSASEVPVQPRPGLYVALGLFTALFLGIGSCVLAELGRTTVHSPAELDALTGLRTLAAVPFEKQREGGALLPRLSETARVHTTSLVTIADGARLGEPIQSFLAGSNH